LVDHLRSSFSQTQLHPATHVIPAGGDVLKVCSTATDDNSGLFASLPEDVRDEEHTAIFCPSPPSSRTPNSSTQSFDHWQQIQSDPSTPIDDDICTVMIQSQAHPGTCVASKNIPENKHTAIPKFDAQALLNAPKDTPDDSAQEFLPTPLIQSQSHPVTHVSSAYSDVLNDSPNVDTVASYTEDTPDVAAEEPVATVEINVTGQHLGPVTRSYLKLSWIGHPHIDYFHHKKYPHAKHLRHVKHRRYNFKGRKRWKSQDIIAQRYNFRRPRTGNRRGYETTIVGELPKRF
jgi:hypothetical protein